MRPHSETWTRGEQGDEIGRFWDALVDGEPAAAGGLEPELAETVRDVHGIADVPGPDPHLVAQIWADALRQAGVAAPAPALEPDVRRQADPRAARFRRAANGALCTLATGAVAGFLAGAIAIGLGMRVAMRVAAALTDPAQRGLLTENGEEVGRMTLDGTIGLVLTGAMVGAFGGMIYQIVRPWLPWAGWRRGLLFGVMLFAVGGQSLFEHGQNPDYRRFGIAGLNVCLFGLLPILFGAMVGPLADRLEPRMTLLFAPRRMGVGKQLLWAAVVLPVVLVILIGFVGLLFYGGFVGLVLLLPMARVLIAHLAGRFDSPADLLRRPLLAAPAYALIIVPCVIGLALTFQSIGRILG